MTQAEHSTAPAGVAPPRRGWGGLPPGPRGLPIVGSALAFNRDKLGYLRRCYERYGRAFTLPVFGMPCVFLIGPEANRAILSEHATRMLWRPAFTNLIPLLGDGLLVTDGELHDRQRRLMLPVFQRGRVEGYLPIMCEYAARYVASWRPGQVLDVDAAMRALTLQIAGRTLFGIDVVHERTTLAEDFERAIAYSDTRRPFDRLKLDVPFSPWRRFLRARVRLDRFVYRLIRERGAAGAGGDRDDALSALLSARDEDGTGLSARHVRDQVIMLLAAGHETTAHGLAWTLYLLARHPAALARVLDEQRAVLGDAAPTPETLRQLGYLEMAIKEALRLYPPAWAGPRVTATEIEFEGYRIPPGTYVIYCQWLSHRLPEVFADPEAFRPERFDPEQGEAHPPYAYVPFGGGARLCIGMAFALQEMKAVLSALLARWRLELVPGQRIVAHPAVTLLPRRGIRMRVASAAAAPTT